MEEIKGLSFANKKAAAFGSYGWSGESVKVISAMLQASGFEVVNKGIRGLWKETLLYHMCVKIPCVT